MGNPMTTASQSPRLKIRCDYLMRNTHQLGIPDEVVRVTAAVPVTVGVKGSAEFPERTEIWYAFRAAGDKTAKLLAHPSRLSPLPKVTL
jgi:hypothetical protein